MIIGITADFLTGDGGVPSNGGAHYEVISHLAAGQPKHRFYLFTATPVESFQPQLPSNVILQKKPGYKHPLLQKFWYDVQLARLLQKHQVDVFLSLEGYCSRTSKIPQCLLMQGSFSSDDLERRKQSGDGVYNWLLTRMISRAGSVIAGSLRQKQHLESLRGSKSNNIEVVYGGIGTAHLPLSPEDRAAVRQQYTEGMEYFIYEGPIGTRNILPVLKAFSLFKKRQQTSWKLVLCGDGEGIEKGFDKLMGAYKYRQDVVLAAAPDMAEHLKLQGAAYGAIDTSTHHQSIAPALAWMQRGVPYMGATSNPVREISPDGALFFNAGDPADIAEKFMQLYKDEALHAALTGKGLALAKEYSWRTTADHIWKIGLRLQGREQ